MSNQYLLHLPDGTEYGPVDRATLEAWSREGRLPAETLVWPEGAPEWMAIEKALAAPAAAASPAPARARTGLRAPGERFRAGGRRPAGDAALDAHARLRRQGARAARRPVVPDPGAAAGRVAQPPARPRGDRGRRGGPGRPVGGAASVHREAAGDRRGAALRPARPPRRGAAGRPRRRAPGRMGGPARGQPLRLPLRLAPAPGPARGRGLRRRLARRAPAADGRPRRPPRRAPPGARPAHALAEGGGAVRGAAGPRSRPPGPHHLGRRPRADAGRDRRLGGRVRPLLARGVGPRRRRETPSPPSWTRCAVGSRRRARSKRASTRRWSVWRWRCRNFPGTRSVFSLQSA